MLLRTADHDWRVIGLERQLRNDYGEAHFRRWKRGDY